ncbi:MAG: serine hydrolase [Acidobacteriia bacterium]|nr:serine hydrolase [Terriglobia bacterium]
MSDCCGKSKGHTGGNACATFLAAAALSAAQSNLDQVVEHARREFEVPGIAVAVVKDGNTVLAKGYGVLRLGEPAPVTPQSLFRIGSNTKAFTAAALAMLVDEGKLRWNDRVIDHMPGFQMYDPYVTREMMVRDLLVHRSGLGLGAGDLMFWPSTDLTRDQIVQRIRFLKPATSFRSGYAYDNLLYLVAGQLIPLITGKTWDDFVKERIFVPLGMTVTNAGASALLAARDVATPHARADGKVVPIAQSDHDNNAPAGAMNSSVSDLAKWLIVQLNHGELPGGRRLFSAAQSKEMWSAQTIVPIEDLPANAPTALVALQPKFNAYGLAWMLRDYRGSKLVYHTGTLAGYVSRVTMVPDRRLGVVVLTNQEETGAHAAITWTILDYYLGAPPTDWVTAFRNLAKVEAAQGEAEVKKGAGKRNANSRPSLPPGAYAGRYRDAWYGDVEIEERGGKLTISFTHTKQLVGELEHWQYDTFVARWKDRTLGADAFVTFWLGADGSIEEVKMAPVSPLTDFSFDFQDLALRPVAAGVAAR